MISTRMMGWVKKIHVTEGQSVKKGDPLISIDDTDLRAKKSQALAGIAEAEAVLANAEKMAGRFERLYAEKSVSKSQLDDVLTGRDRAAAGVNMAKAGLREVNVHLSYLDITAPSDGVVARLMVEEGDMANPGMPLVNLEQTDLIKAVAHLGEKDISKVKVGDYVTVECLQRTRRQLRGGPGPGHPHRQSRQPHLRYRGHPGQQRRTAAQRHVRPHESAHVQPPGRAGPRPGHHPARTADRRLGRERKQ